VRPAGLASVLALILLAAVACRPQPPVRLAQPPADRHAPFNYVGTKAMVVAAHPLAAEAGRDMLKRGGNAVDAAVTTAFTLNAVEPFASGIGGGGFMVLYLAKTKKVTVVNFREQAPAAATPTMFREKGDAMDEWRTARGTAVGVPGMLAGWAYALRKYGTKTLAETAARAIEIAERGFPVSSTFSAINKDEYEKLLRNAGEATCYLNQGIPYEPGDVLRNPDLARTLKSIAAGDIDAFYKGDIARKIVAAVHDKGGVMSLADLENFRPLEVEPVLGIYKGLTIYAAPPPAAGGLHILQLLNIAEPWPLKAWGHNSAPYIHHLSEALRFLFADKDRYDADPGFTPMTLGSLLSAEYAARVRNGIRPDRIAGSYPFSRLDRLQDREGNTTHVGVIDPDGNIVALTQSINDFFGTGIVPEGTGFLLNDHMADFSTDPASLNAPNPGRRPVSNMGPLIVLKDGRPVLTLGSPGGTRIFPTLSQIILNLVEFGMSLDEAIEAPRFFTSSANGRPGVLAVEPRISESVLKALEQMGHTISLKEPYDKYFGGAQGVMILRDKHVIHGGADSRRDGVGAGY